LRMFFKNFVYVAACISIPVVVLRIALVFVLSLSGLYDFFQISNQDILNKATINDCIYLLVSTVLTFYFIYLVLKKYVYSDNNSDDVNDSEKSR